ncbi:hypothetical protein CER19_06565 [Pseudomonas sp. GL93]|uniref:hypothetical protein n=1 Tax=Pseudomonas sp. GL93 TaxID=2014741 RepID=UPI000E316648|nr:hypothetical protein [Pseudomonas sp. GL93]RFD31548.1 hypothetical protein CER19_06565 [Pseudomonas sp. GL93]
MTELTTRHEQPTPSQRQDGDRQMLNTLIAHLKTQPYAPADLLPVPAHCALGCWLVLYRQALGHPSFVAWAGQRRFNPMQVNVRNGTLYANGATFTDEDASGWQQLAPPIRAIAQIIDPDAIGLAYPAADLSLSARQVLRFQGCPQPTTLAQRGVLIDALGRTEPALADAFERLNQDLHATANALHAQIVEDDLNEQTFNLLSVYRCRFRLACGSFWGVTMNTAATLLGEITEHPQFLALTRPDSLTPGLYEFDHLQHSIRGAGPWGQRVDISHEQLSPLPLGDRLERLQACAAAMNLLVHQDGQFSLAQLLSLHDLPLPDNREAAWELMEQLRRSEPVPVPPVSDLVHSDVALLQYRQRLETTRLASPQLGSYWEALGMPLPGALTLSTEQRAKVIHISATFVAQPSPGLFNLLAADLPPGPPDEQLQQLLAAPRAQKLADLLLGTMGWFGHAPGEATSNTSRDALVLAALILSLDPQAAQARYTVAGLNLNHSDFHGHRYADLRRSLELHLIEVGVATPQTTALAAHLLLAGIAPEFLVQGIPDSLYFMTSHAWMLFKQGVMLAEELACGSTRQLAFSDIIALATQEPATDQERLWREYYATATLIDWAICQGELQPAQAYRTEEIDAVKERLKARIKTLHDAAETLRSKLITRRRLALEDLKRVFPNHRWLKKKCLQEGQDFPRLPSLRSTTGVKLQSLVDLHMGGHLHPIDDKWRSTDPELDLSTLKKSFGQLRDINALFIEAAGAYTQQLKEAYTRAISYLLSQLPLADRKRLHEGAVQLLVVRQAASKPQIEEGPGEKIARTGRFGFILRCTAGDTRHDYELFPLLNQVQKNTRLPATLELGGRPLKVATGAPHSTRPIAYLHEGSRLAIDEDAYFKGSPPTPGKYCNVIVDRLWHVAGLPTTARPLVLDSPRNLTLASNIVSQHFFIDIDTWVAQAKGLTTLEQRKKNSEQLLEALLGFIPFWTCGHDLASGEIKRVLDGTLGCFFDMLGLIMPTKGLITNVGSRLGKTAPAYVKLLQLAKLSTAYLNELINPLDAVPGLVRLTAQGLAQLNHSGRRALTGALRHAQQRLAHGTIDYARLINRADIEPGVLTHAEGLVHLLAIRRTDAWYAFDLFSARPYGPALEGLQLDTAMAVTPVSLADGYKALVAEPFFDTTPLLIQRADATDLLDQGRVWRLQHAHPSHLDELTSAAHAYLTEPFENTCAAGRTKRSPVPLICFTKRLYAFKDSIHKRRVQALDHIRIEPAPMIDGGRRKLVHNRSVHEVTPHYDGFELPRQRQHPALIYQPQVRGRRIDNEPQFGLPEDDLDPLLARQTQVVEINGIASTINDRRTLRALEITLPGTTTSYWVAEADIGAFYRTHTSRSGDDSLLFEQLNFGRINDDTNLIRAFCAKKREFFRLGEMIPDQPLVTLPTLEVLYRQLGKRGFSPERIESIRKKAGPLRVIKQRELLLNASDEGRRLDIHVVSRPVQLAIWPPRPATGGQINRYLAEQANASTQAVVERTGLRSANVVGSTRGENLRLQEAEPVVMWEYSKIGHPNYTEVILKTGAGNCDQMAHVACEMIRTNGGVAHIWSCRGHTFVVVGTIPAGLTQTLDFQGADWANLYICDPWTSITCPAQDYMRQLRIKMTVWYLEDKMVFFHDGANYRWALANHPIWLNILETSIKFAQP